MSYPHQGESHGLDGQRAEQPRSAFAGPQLNLPRFQFAPSTPTPQQQSPQPAPTRPHPAPTYAQPAPTYAQPAPTYAQPAPTYAQPTYQQPVHAQPAPQVQHAPQPHGQLTYAMAPAPSAAAVAPRPATPRPAPALMANTTTRATVSWDTAAPVSEPTLLQRITPVHMGVLMVIVMAFMVMTSGPAAMNAAPSRLPAVTTNGGGSVPMPVRAGTTAVAAASAPAGTAKAAATPAAGAKGAAKAAAPRVRRGARMIAVGNARVRANVRAGGIPSPAASANLAIAGGGRVSAADTGSVQMGGIPSPAASEQLGPQKLPFRPTDGVTLPRAIGERDSHAVDRHYGTSATLPMEEPALPAMTPGASAARAEHQVQVNNLTGGSTPQPVAGGLAMAY